MGKFAAWEVCVRKPACKMPGDDEMERELEGLDVEIRFGDTVEGLLYALSDPVRAQIYAEMATSECP